MKITESPLQRTLKIGNCLEGEFKKKKKSVAPDAVQIARSADVQLPAK